VEVRDSKAGNTLYEYDAAGNVKKETLANGVVESRQYDVNNLLTQLVTKDANGAILFSQQITYDQRRNITKLEENAGRVVNFTYDLVDQLTREEIVENGTVSRVITYRYDAVGNRLERNDSVEGMTIYTYNTLNQLATSTKTGVTTTYTYDDNGSLIRQESPTKLIVNQWNSEKRLIGVTITENGVTKNIQYKYNTEGIRTAQIVDGQETRYLIDVTRPYAQVREEYQADGDVMSYVSGLGGDLISQVEIGDNEKRFYVADYLDSTRLLTNTTSGLTGDKYVYDAYGRTLTQTGITDNSYRFAGEAFDDVTGLQYLRDRYMDPNTGRFTRRDTFPGYEEKPVTTHPYIYANNNPVMFTDPSGFFSLAELLNGIKAQAQLAAQRVNQFVQGKKWIDRAEGSSDLIFVSALLARVGYDVFLRLMEEDGSNVGDGTKENKGSPWWSQLAPQSDGADGARAISGKFEKPFGNIKEMELELSVGNLGELVEAGKNDSWEDVQKNLAFKIKGSISTKKKQQQQFSARWSAEDGLTFGAAWIYEIMKFESPKDGPMAGSDLSARLVIGGGATVNTPKMESGGYALTSPNMAARAQMSFNASFANFYSFDYPLLALTAYKSAIPGGFRTIISFQGFRLYNEDYTS
jgi:RHS repeat-associated protein